MAKLYVVATPIGNLSDMTPRAIETLKSCALIAAEDTRVTGALCAHFDIHTRLLSSHRHNEEQKAPAIVEQMLAEDIDVAVVTDDNPRTEEPRAIINDILTGMLDAGHAKVMEGRAEAVTCAVMQAKENDVVLVAGKGHEDYQIVGNQRLDYSDRVTVARLLGVIA